ncbi:MAG: hypothetical protein ACI8RZ_007627, partial [Myxococcota bacterium]
REFGCFDGDDLIFGHNMSRLNQIHSRNNSLSAENSRVNQGRTS